MGNLPAPGAHTNSALQKRGRVTELTGLSIMVTSMIVAFAISDWGYLGVGFGGLVAALGVNDQRA